MMANLSVPSIPHEHPANRIHVKGTQTQLVSAVLDSIFGIPKICMFPGDFRRNFPMIVLFKTGSLQFFDSPSCVCVCVWHNYRLSSYYQQKAACFFALVSTQKILYNLLVFIQYLLVLPFDMSKRPTISSEDYINMKRKQLSLRI